MSVLVALILAAPLQFKELAPGIEYGTTAFGEGLLHLVRIDPTKAELKVGLASRDKVKNRTAGQWADGLGFTVAIRMTPRTSATCAPASTSTTRPGTSTSRSSPLGRAQRWWISTQPARRRSSRHTRRSFRTCG